MPAITIRNVPQSTRDELAARAAANGQSLQEYLAGLLRSVVQRPDLDRLLSDVRARKAAAAQSVSTEEILAHRDADRR